MKQLVASRPGTWLMLATLASAVLSGCSAASRPATTTASARAAATSTSSSVAVASSSTMSAAPAATSSARPSTPSAPPPASPVAIASVPTPVKTTSTARPAPVTTTTQAPSSGAKVYSNCAALRVDYPHGVARTGGVDLVKGVAKAKQPAYVVDDAVYKANRARDGDSDGVACEQ